MPASALKVSFNELNAIIRRCLEGFYGDGYDYIDMAHVVFWMEAHDLGGASLLVKSLSNLDLEREKPSFERQGEDQFLLDGKGVSLIALLGGLTDLANLYAGPDRLIDIHIKNVTEPEMIVAALVRCVKFDISAQALWRGGTARIEAGKALPSLTLGNHRGLVLSCGKLPPLKRLHSVSSKALCESYTKGLREGRWLDKEYIRALNAVGDRILVASSEESRKGAGE